MGTVDSSGLGTGGMGAYAGMSPLEAAKEFYTIPVLAKELCPDWQEPRRPGESCKAPYREDKHPSFVDHPWHWWPEVP